MRAVEEARLDLHGLGLVLDRSYDYLVRNWRRMCREDGLPQPFVGRNGRCPRWSRKAVEAWRDGEPIPSAAGGQQPTPPLPSNDPVPVRKRGAAALLKAAGG